MSKLDNLEEWKRRISDCENSGLKIKKWCTKNGYTEGAYYYWVKKIKKDSKQLKKTNTVKEHNWAEIVLKPECQKSIPVDNKNEDNLILKYHNYSISIPNGFNQKTLTELLKILHKI